MKRPQKSQQLATLAELAFAKDGSSAGGTPTPGYARNPVPLHSGSDDSDGVGEPLAATDALTDGVIDGVAGGGAGATRVELALGARPSNDALGQIVALMAKHVPRPTVALVATKTNAAQLVKFVLLLLRLMQKPQQLDMPVPLIFTRDGSSAGDTPSPEYGRRAVPAHSGNDDGDRLRDMLADTLDDWVTERPDVGDTNTLGDMLGDLLADTLDAGVTERPDVGDTDTLGDTLGVMERPDVGDTDTLGDTLGNKLANTLDVGVTERPDVGDTDTLRDTLGVMERPDVGDTDTLGDTLGDKLANTLDVGVTERPDVGDTDTLLVRDTLGVMERPDVGDTDTLGDTLGVMERPDVGDTLSCATAQDKNINRTAAHMRRDSGAAGAGRMAGAFVRDYAAAIVAATDARHRRSDESANVANSKARAKLNTRGRSQAVPYFAAASPSPFYIITSDADASPSLVAPALND
jgi:hypothetical protein